MFNKASKLDIFRTYAFQIQIFRVVLVNFMLRRDCGLKCLQNLCTLDLNVVKFVQKVFF